MMEWEKEILPSLSKKFPIKWLFCIQIHFQVIRHFWLYWWYNNHVNQKFAIILQFLIKSRKSYLYKHPHLLWHRIWIGDIVSSVFGRLCKNSDSNQDFRFNLWGRITDAYHPSTEKYFKLKLKTLIQKKTKMTIAK